MKIIVLPHAGGMAYSYMGMSQYEDQFLQFEYVELPGRGTRMGENFCYNFEEAVKDVYEQIYPVIKSEEYAIFGHSMGSWLAYELYYKIKSENAPLPIHIFFSGNICPLCIEGVKKYSEMDDRTFIMHILEMDQTPKEIFVNPELRSIFLPILRADYYLLENYCPDQEREQLECNISFLGGRQDPFLQSGVKEWGMVTGREFYINYYEGGHFYLFDHLEQVVDMIYKLVEAAMICRS